MRLVVCLKPEKVTQVLLKIVLALVFLSLVGQFSRYFLPDFPLKDYFIKVFDVDLERNAPALYSCTTLLFCSLLLFAIASEKRSDRDRYSRHWMGLSFIFLYLALDEAAQFHEKLVQPVRSVVPVPSIFFYAWVLPFSLLVGIFILNYIKFVKHLPPRIKKLFVLAAAIYIGGALGMELASGYYVARNGIDNFPFQLLATLEELMEMLGIIVFINALLSYINLCIKEVSLEFRLAASASSQESAIATPYEGGTFQSEVRR